MGSVSFSRLAYACATSGVSSDGLSTTELPATSAGITVQCGIASGKFHGVIAAQTPSGSWWTCERSVSSENSVVQTFSPDAPSIVAATRHDYLGFAAGELPNRKEYNYPPFGFMARIVIRGESKAKSEQLSERIADELKNAAEDLGLPVEVLGPAPAPVEKLRGRFRYHIQLLTGQKNALQETITRAKTKIKPPDDVQWIVDIDPQDML